MTRFLFFFLLLLPASSAWAWPGAVVRVVDGDTVLVAPLGVTGADVSVRLYGIDAPELRQEGGKAARDALRALVQPGEEVEVVSVHADRYHRAAALLLHKGRFLNLEMLKAGHAWVDTRHCRASFCSHWGEVARHAQSEGLGLWGESAPTPPWQWRKDKK